MFSEVSGDELRQLFYECKTLQKTLVTAGYSRYSRKDMFHMGDATWKGRWLSIVQMKIMPPSTVPKLERLVT
jgi:hypothetical protein